MDNRDTKDALLKEQIKKLRKALEHENNLVRKHTKKWVALFRELVSIRDQRKLLFPEQYTKSGILRKKYKNEF